MADHPDSSTATATWTAQQYEQASRAVLRPDVQPLPPLQVIAGADISVAPDRPEVGIVVISAVQFFTKDSKYIPLPVYWLAIRVPMSTAYIPGCLAAREAGPYQQAWDMAAARWASCGIPAGAASPGDTGAPWDAVSNTVAQCLQSVCGGVVDLADIKQPLAPAAKAVDRMRGQAEGALRAAASKHGDDSCYAAEWWASPAGVHSALQLEGDGQEPASGQHYSWASPADWAEHQPVPERETVVLNRTPQLYMLDSNGTLHARGAGAAVTVGQALNVATCGVAKQLYVVSDATVQLLKSTAAAAMPAASDSIWPQLPRAGAVAPIHVPQLQPTAGIHPHVIEALPTVADAPGRRALGALARCAAGSQQPVCISPGHRCGVADCTAAALLGAVSRIPEATRVADFVGRAFLRLLCRAR